MSFAPQPDDEQGPIEATLRICRITELALVAGVGVFLIVVAVIRRDRLFADDAWSLDTPLSLLALGYAALVVVLHLVIPGQVVTQGRRALARAEWPIRDPVGSARWSELALAGLLRLYQTAFILGSAILEGGALFAGVAYLIEGKAPCLIAAVLLLVGLAYRIPGRAGLEGWIDAQGHRVEEERAGLS